MHLGQLLTGPAPTAGALTPIVLPTLLGISAGSPILIFAYLAVLCVVAAGCVLATRRLTVVAGRADSPLHDRRSERGTDRRC